jgi:hypothetical protein
MPDEAVEPVALRAEFDAMLARSDLCVIPDRLEGTLSNYAELRRLTGILHMFNPLLNPESEPAHVFRLSSLLRKP